MSNSAITPTAFYNPLLTNWAAYTATYGGVTATGTTYWRRVGDTLEVHGFVDATATSAALFSISLPSVTIDSAKIPATQKNWLGMLVVSGSGTAIYSGAVGLGVVYDSTDATKVYIAFQNNTDGSGLAVGASQLASNIFSASSQATFKFAVPVTQWAF